LKALAVKKGVTIHKVLHEQGREKLEKLRKNQMKTKCVMENSTKDKSPQRKKIWKTKS